MVYPVFLHSSRISTPDLPLHQQKLFCARLRDATSVQRYQPGNLRRDLYACPIGCAQTRPNSFFVGTIRSLGAVHGFDAKCEAIPEGWSQVIHMSTGTRRETITLTGMIVFARYFLPAAVCRVSQPCYKPNKAYCAPRTRLFSAADIRSRSGTRLCGPSTSCWAASVEETHFTAQCEPLYDSTTFKINICGGV